MREYQISRSPAADAAEGDEKNRGRELGDPPLAAALTLGDEPCEPQVPRDRPGDTFAEGRS